MDSLLTRVLVSIFGIPIILAIVYFGGLFFAGFILLVSLLAQIEFYSMVKKNEMSVYFLPGLLAGIVWILGVQFFPGYLFEIFLGLGIMIFLLNLSGLIEGSTKKLSVTLVGFIYIPVFLSCMIMLRNIPGYVEMDESQGFNLILLLLVTIWICDTFAYFFGSWFGKKKIAPKISPNKSIVGSVSGLVGAIVVGLVFYLFNLKPDFMNFMQIIIFVIIAGVVSQLGDFTESVFKRDNKIKDSGKILLGHGGVLDRFDTFFITAPVIYIYVFFII